MNGTTLSFKAPFNLKATLECGQAFRWERNGQGYQGVIGRTVARVKEEDGALKIWPRGFERQIQRYLHLDGDYSSLEVDLAGDPVMKPVVEFASGLRVLRQDVWEALISFVISANNNIPRIKGIIHRLSSRFGEPLDLGFYSFPSPDSIARSTEAELRALGLGFRAPYVLGAARAVEGGLELQALGKMEFSEAKDVLVSLPGVGPKVADCVLLFSLDKYEAFPLDVWVKRAMENLYFQDRPVPVREIQGMARARFGPLAGFAQSYMFHWARHNLVR